MKRIISILLAIICVFSLASCGEADDVISIVNSSRPTKITTQTTYNTENDKLVGSFVTTINGSDSELVYEYQRYATVEEGVAEDNPDEYIKTLSGTVYYKDGKYSTDNENWTTEAPDATTMQVKLNLTEKNLGKYTVSKDGKTLTATTTAEKASKILGVSISATADVKIVIKHDGTSLRSISVSYSTENAEYVEISTSYSYNKVVEEEPETEE
jgi:hypothetical protein